MTDRSVPLEYFLQSDGLAAQPVMHLNWVFTAISLGVCLVVAFLLSFALFHKRAADPGPIAHHGEGLPWVYIGTGISICILLSMTVYMLAVLNKTATPSSTPALTLTVTAAQWWWKVEYGD